MAAGIINFQVRKSPQNNPDELVGVRSGAVDMTDCEEKGSHPSKEKR
jgi:hypothetical protein